MRISDWSSDVCSSDLAANPFPEETQREPNRVLALLSKSPPPADAADRLMERAQAGERVTASGSALWFHFPDGAGTSDRKSVVEGKSVSVRVDLGGRRILTTKKQRPHYNTTIDK